MASKSKGYRKGQAFVFNGEPGWIIHAVAPKGLVIKSKDGKKAAWVPFETIKP